jgi:hypothetical protein
MSWQEQQHKMQHSWLSYYSAVKVDQTTTGQGPAQAATSSAYMLKFQGCCPKTAMLHSCKSYLECCKHPLACCGLHHIAHAVQPRHAAHEGMVHAFKHEALLRQLLADVFTANEDVL